MAANDRRFSIIEQLFGDMLSKDMDRKTFEKKLGLILSELPLGKSGSSTQRREYTISVIPNEARQTPFFGFRVFPTISDMQDITKMLSSGGGSTPSHTTYKQMYEKWENLKNWYIEIDDTCFNPMEISFTPRELTAMLFHEIGHVIYSDDVLEVFYRAYQDMYVRMKLSEKKSLRFLNILYTIPLATACMLRTWVNGKNEIRREYLADQSLASIGYTEDMISALNKIIRAYGNSIVDTTSSKREAKVESVIRWCNVNIVDLVNRKKRMKDQLVYTAVQANSGFMKAASIYILNKLGVEMQESYTGETVEMTLESLGHSHLMETYRIDFFNLKKVNQYEPYIVQALHGGDPTSITMESHRGRSPEPPSQYDLDVIAVQADRISNHADRVYVLDLIYDQLNKISEFEDFYSGNSSMKRKYGDSLKGMRGQLESIRTSVLGKHAFNRDYKLFVKYPPGYEG